MANRFSFPLYLFSILALSACFLPKREEASNNEMERTALLKVDNDFSAMSAAKGMKNAFLEYIDSNGVLLRPNIIPVVGADAVDYLIAFKDDGFVMTWKPKDASVALSGELGYTYGTYELHPNNVDTVLYGTYVSVWKKQADGKWKFILDSGNEGLSKEAEE